jgi:hypothetical protein
MDREGKEGSGHPLPGSDESRHGEIPEGAVEQKGFGDDAAELVQPALEAANPDGEPYRYGDNGRAEDIETGGRGHAEDMETGASGRGEDVETGEGATSESLGPGTPV